MYPFPMEWKRTREMYALAQEMRRELPEQRQAERGPLAPLAYSRMALGTVLACSGAAIADIACTIRDRMRREQ